MGLGNIKLFAAFLLAWVVSLYLLYIVYEEYTSPVSYMSAVVG